jgi:hypothetical protein
VLEAPPGTEDCLTLNRYFVGGVGDFSVQLDPDSSDLYFFFSQYLEQQQLQGIGVARLAWADRDEPTGKIMLWQGRSWLPASDERVEDAVSWAYPPAIPILQETGSPNGEKIDLFWGPSVHWNSYLQQYVMLLNRAIDSDMRQEGVYISFSPTLDDPRAWSTPVKILEGGDWYPQIMGLEPGIGTDKIAGERARLFVAGVSRYSIRFIK